MNYIKLWITARWAKNVGDCLRCIWGVRFQIAKFWGDGWWVMGPGRGAWWWKSYLGNRQLQLDHVLRFGDRGLEGRVQEQDAIQVLPASHRVVIHKQDLVHCWEVLTPHASPRFCWKESNKGGGWELQERTVPLDYFIETCGQSHSAQDKSIFIMYSVCTQLLISPI